MKRLVTFLVIAASVLSGLVGQSKRDPRAVALAGAYSTIADGIFAVGYNPALLAYQVDKPFMLQVFGFDFGILGNYFSLANLNAISGDTLSQTYKDALFRTLDRSGGLAFFSDFHSALPFLNYGSGNMAFTSNLMIMGDFKLPTGLLRLILDGNARHPRIDMTLNYEILGVNEFGFSFAVPFTSYAWGVTLKYLQGLFYLGIDPDSSQADLVTSDVALSGSGTYFLRQGIGGGGIGLDVGFATRDINGWRFGISIINMIGSINWNKPTLSKDILAGSDNIYGNGDDWFHFTWGGEVLNDSMAVRYTYTIDSISGGALTGESLFSSTNKVIRNLDKDGEPKVFKINYPAILRLGLSRRTGDYLISSDLITGFEDRFFAQAGWRWSLGVELRRFPSLPLRIGFAWGGMDNRELGLGFGLYKGPLIFDFGFAFRNGIWIHSMKGVNLSTSLTMTSFRSRKEAPPEGEEGPAPLPEEALEPESEAVEPGSSEPGSLKPGEPESSTPESAASPSLPDADQEEDPPD